jgi:aminoglycoside phosphotransferase (APT) family kinase protein
MQLPEHVDVSVETVAAIAEQYGLPAAPITRLPDTGIFNAIYLVGEESVLRIPRQHPGHERALYRESIVVPLARGVGVRTPALLVYDDSRTLLPVSYTIYERVHGETLAHLDLEPEQTPEAWRELGHDLARLHGGVDRAGPGGAVGERAGLSDPRELTNDLAGGGWITPSEARWLTRWLDRIAPAAGAQVESRLCHGDTQSTNVMVRSRTGQYVAVLDWGGASWDDPVRDFGGVPLRAVPFLLEGYRTCAPLEADDTAEARILWWHLQLALSTAQRGPQPNHSWAERPLTMLLEIARFFLVDRSGPWHDLRPG